ncbi:MAG: WecB/TagA/CpsF family glycosyltransferase [Gammaproteobacteria bacterium]
MPIKSSQEGTVNILGYQVSNQGLASDVSLALEFINSENEAKYMACANPHSLVEAERDAQFQQSLRNADILLPDGAGILLAGKILNIPVAERVAGNEFYITLMAKLNNDKRLAKIFFLGSTEEVLNKLVARVKSDFPNVEICGTYSPPFKSEFSEEDDQVMIDVINNSKPDVLWVGMTAPKQEKWIYKNKDRLNVKFIGAIGAVFDFYSGTKKRAPQWVCKLGLEWLPRLLREPKRLWRRNFVSSPLFLFAVLKQKIEAKTVVLSG